jgi:uncharacterized protein
MKSLILVFFLLISVSFSQSNKFIEINGTANIEYPADQVNWTVNINRLAETFEESTDQVNAILKELLDILDKSGINKNDIQISPLQQSRFYEYSNDRKTRIFKGFNTNLIVSFILKDMMKYSQLVSNLSRSDGFENIRSSYSDSKYEIHHKETFIKATNEAKNKALYLSENLGKKIGSVLEVVENNNSFPNPMNSSASLQYEQPVVTGKVSYTRSVTIKFELID